MREEFTIERGGKTFVLFAGLLDEAHSAGLRAIDTELLAAPTEANGQTAIIKATVEMEDGRTFTGIGDASPDNVGRNIVPHLIRMAETRAKARALRDAINIGVTALEELGGPEEEEETPRKEKPNLHQVGNASVAKLAELATSLRGPEGVGKLEKKIGRPLDDLSSEEVASWIGRLQKAAEKEEQA